MKAVGLLLLLAGLVIVMTAFVLLPQTVVRGAFVMAGIAVQILGLAFTFRSHQTLDEERGW